MCELSDLNENKTTLDLLKEVPGLDLLTDEELTELVISGRFCEYQAGEEIIIEGEFDRWIYFLLNGEVEIIKDNQIVGRLNKIGDLFGEMSIIDDAPRSTSIRAISPAVTLGIDASVIDKKLNVSSKNLYAVMYRLFAEVLSARLRKANEIIAQQEKH
jgi:CRP-like cAMP-binding protein